jgi:hypothetical protein
MVKDNQAETIRIGTAGLLRAFLPSRGLLIIGERGEARFQPLKLAYLVGAARGLYQLSAFGRLLLNALWSIAAHIVKTTLPCLRLLRLHPIGRTEIFSGMGDQLCVAWMIDRFHADDRVHQLGIMVVNVFHQFGLRAGRPGDENGAGVRDRSSNSVKKVVIGRCVPTPNGVGLVVDVLGRMIRTQNQTLDIRRAEMKHARLMVVDPNDGMVVMLIHEVSPRLVWRIASGEESTSS